MGKEKVVYGLIRGKPLDLKKGEEFWREKHYPTISKEKKRKSIHTTGIQKYMYMYIELPHIVHVPLFAAKTCFVTGGDGDI